MNFLLPLINVALPPLGNNKHPNLKRREERDVFVLTIYPVQGQYLSLFAAITCLFPSLFIIVLLVTVKLRLENMKTNPKKFSFKD